MRYWKSLRSTFLLTLLLVTVTLCPLSAFALDPQPEPPGEATNIQVFIDGSPLKTDVTPLQEQGRTLVPLRAIFEALGATVQWNEADQSVTATKGELSVKLQIGSNIAFKNGLQAALDVPPVIVKGRTLVPVRFVSEALGAQVAWDKSTSKVSITSASGQTAQPVQAQQTTFDPAKIKNITEKVHGDFSQLVRVQKVPAASALQQQKDFLLKQTEVKSVTDIKGGNLFVEFQDGYQMLMLLGEDKLGTETVTGGTTQLQVVQPVQNTQTITNSTIPAIIKPDVPTIIKPDIPGIFRLLYPLHPGSSKALIFDSLEDDANVISPKIQYQVESDLAALGYTVVKKLNNDANLTNAALIDDGEYGVVFMRGHGGVIGNSFGFLVRPWYSSPPPMNSGYTGTIPASATSYASGAVTKYGYVITGQFSSTYWTSKAFPKTMFFLESCHGTDPGGLPGMPTWTINHGAGAWLGWNDSVSFGNGDNGSKLFFDKMLQRKDVSEAVAAVIAAGYRPPDLTVHTSDRGGYKLAEWRYDPNEPAVPDGRDFKLLKMVASSSNLFADITFYTAPSFDEFFFYANTDWESSAEVLIKCRPNNFEIYKKTGPGLYTNKVFTGTPSTSGNTYSLTIPLSTAFDGKGPGSIQIWLNDMTGKDRLPDLPVVK